MHDARALDPVGDGGGQCAADTSTSLFINRQIERMDAFAAQSLSGASGTRNEHPREAVATKSRREMVDAVGRSRGNVVAESPADCGGPSARLATLDETRRRRRGRASASPRKRRAESGGVRSRIASRARAMREHRSIVLAIRRTLSHNRDEIKTVSSGGAQAMRKRSRFRKRVVRIFRR